MKSRPERVPLTRERVLDAAIVLADREGVDALSMRRLGAELGVQAMSLYNHVANKGDLLDGVAGRLLAHMQIPAVGEVRWDDGLRQVCRAYRRLAHDHPDLFPLVFARPLASPEVLPPLEATLALLRQAGLDAQAALDVFEACASFVGGFALGDINRKAGRQLAPELNERGQWPATDLLDDRSPVTADVLRFASPERDRAFEFGLDLILAGLETHRRATKSAPEGPRAGHRSGSGAIPRRSRLRSARTSRAATGPPASRAGVPSRRRRP